MLVQLPTFEMYSEALDIWAAKTFFGLPIRIHWAPVALAPRSPLGRINKWMRLGRPTNSIHYLFGQLRPMLYANEASAQNTFLFGIIWRFSNGELASLDRWKLQFNLVRFARLGRRV